MVVSLKTSETIRKAFSSKKRAVIFKCVVHLETQKDLLTFSLTRPKMFKM